MTVTAYSVNRRELWDEFVAHSKNGTFLIKRGFMDYHADRFFDCSVMVFDGVELSDEEDSDALSLQNLVAVMPANWDERDRCVHSHQGLTYGGLIVKEDVTQKDVITILKAIFLYYSSYLQARKIVYKPIPYIYCAQPSGEDLYALFRAHCRLTHRLVSTVVSLRNPLRMRTLRQRQARKAIDHGFYIDRMAEGDWESLREYWALLEYVLQKYHDARPVHTFEEMQLLMQRFPREIRLFLVREHEKIVAGSILFETRQVARVQYIAADEEGRQYGALDLLFRHLINERYKQMEYVDFGTSNEKGGWYLNDGLVFQKEGFGGRAVCYDTYEVMLDHDVIDRMLDEPQNSVVQEVKFLDLKKVSNSYEPQLSDAVLRVIHRGWFLLGEETQRFEQMFAEYVGARHCVAVGNGLEALTLILRAWRNLLGWQAGDEVIVPANTYIASILAVSNAGLKPVLCEPSLDTYLIDPQNIEALVSERTRAIMPVHLYGRCCDMKAVNEIAQRHGLRVLDDVAQAQGVAQGGVRAGHLCDASGFSFYPGKNLGALGDAGAVTTDDDELASVVRTMANYGSREKYVNELRGYNSRMDEIHAAALSVKLEQLDERNDRRRQIASLYMQGIENPLITLPSLPELIEEHVFHVFAVRCPARDVLKDYLAQHGVETLIHYPIPPHKQKAYQEWNDMQLPITERIHREILSLPMNSVLTDDEVAFVVRLVNAFNVGS
ncbi:MAG: GNAT family N-acetyltransferase [Bacteroidaceae bacterium]|nr:GNAT family N-acetyltransferase [Bacteroidaceae bacterium]